MPLEGVDYSWARPDAVKLKAAGKHFVVRYLSYDKTGKNLDAAEIKALIRAGVAVVANWENRAGDAKGGFGAGQTYAREAVAQTRALGMPDDRPIYFSVDFDMTEHDAVAVGEFFRGIASVLPLHRIGIYGGYNAIRWAVTRKWAAWFWQTYAWSGGRWHPATHLQQYHNGANVAGGDVDLNRAMTDDFGAWGVDDVNAKDVWSYDVDPDGKKAYTAGGVAWTTYQRSDYLANQFAPAVTATLDSLAGRLSQTGVDVASLGLKFEGLSAQVAAVANRPDPSLDIATLTATLGVVVTELSQSTVDIDHLTAKLDNVVAETTKASPAYQVARLTKAMILLAGLVVAVMVFAAIGMFTG